MKDSRLDGSQQIAIDFPSPEPFSSHIFILLLNLGTLSPGFSSSCLFNSVDRKYNEGFSQPYAAYFGILEEHCPATYASKKTKLFTKKLKAKII